MRSPNPLLVIGPTVANLHYPLLALCLLGHLVLSHTCSAAITNYDKPTQLTALESRLTWVSRHQKRTIRFQLSLQFPLIIFLCLL